jgi:hypothetical protein
LGGLVGQVVGQGAADLVVVQAGLAQQRGGVLAERRDGAHGCLDVLEGHRGQQRRDGEVLGLDRPPPVSGVKLGMVDDIGDVFHLRGRDAGAGQPFG